VTDEEMDWISHQLFGYFLVQETFNSSFPFLSSLQYEHGKIVKKKQQIQHVYSK